MHVIEMFMSSLAWDQRTNFKFVRKQTAACLVQSPTGNGGKLGKAIGVGKGPGKEREQTGTL